MKSGSEKRADNSYCPPFLSTVGLGRMKAPKTAVGTFQKVGECLYRYSSNGVYYARIKTSGKEIRRSLETTDPAIAQGNLRKLRNEQSQIDRLRVASRFASCATLTSKQFSTKSRKRSSGRHTS